MSRRLPTRRSALLAGAAGVLGERYAAALSAFFQGKRALGKK